MDIERERWPPVSAFTVEALTITSTCGGTRAKTVGVRIAVMWELTPGCVPPPIYAQRSAVRSAEMHTLASETCSHIHHSAATPAEEPTLCSNRGD